MKVEILQGVDKGKDFELKNQGEFFIGRDKNCAICINDIKSSRRHAKIVSENGEVYLEDLNSTNGTVLNGKTIFKYQLKEKDEIIIGDTLLFMKELKSSKSKETTAAVRIDDDTSTIILASLHPQEADLLTGKSTIKLDALDDLILENTHLRQICEISNLVSGAEEPVATLTTILNNMKKILAADTACVLKQSEDKKGWVIQALADDQDESTVNVSQTIIQQALNEGVAIVSTDPMTDERFDPSASIISEGVSSALCSPLQADNHFHGILFFDRRGKTDVFTQMDLRFTATAGNIVGLFLEKENLENESRKKARLAVIGEVIAGLAHHTKNILTGLKFSINALEFVIERRQFENVAKCLNSVLSQEKRISDLVLNMLSFSKDRVPQKTKVLVTQIIEDVVEPYRQYFAENGIQLKLELPSQCPPIQAEEPALHRAFLNLVVNAMDSFKSPDAPSSKLLKISVQPLRDKKSIQIQFYDTGCGIPPEKSQKIFTVFYSTKGAEGTGLGLAVVHKTVEEHGGSVAVDSKVGEWTLFTIVLPVGLAREKDRGDFVTQ